MLLNTDDVLAIIEESKIFIREEFRKRFTLQDKSIGFPEYIFANNAYQATLKNVFKC